VRDTTAFVGDGGRRFYLGRDPAEADPVNAVFVVYTTSPEDAVIIEIRARRYLAENFPAARSTDQTSRRRQRVRHRRN
jgi:hypothetical protein